MKKAVIVLLLFSIEFAVNAQCWKSVSASLGYHSLGIKSDGSLWAWGLNNYGQLGDGTNNTRYQPVLISSDSWIAIAAGAAFSIGIKSDSTLWTWGYNANGQLADGSTTNRNFPKQIGTAKNWKYVSAGVDHVAALKSNGTLWAWGDNSFFQAGVGIGPPYTVAIPTQISNDTNWKIISAGAYHTLALKSNGVLWGWGLNASGELGDGTTTGQPIPIQIGYATNWQMLSAGGGGSSHGIKTNGTLWAWGNNDGGQLGDGTTIGKTVPTQIGYEMCWKDVSSGGDHSMAIKTNNTLWTWGTNIHGQLGDGSNLDAYQPKPIGTSTDWVSINAGFRYSLAIKSGNSLVGWGFNSYAVLGDGTIIDKNAPEEVSCFPVGIEVQSFQTGGFSIFPNPSSEILNIKGSMNQNIEMIEIADLYGKLIIAEGEISNPINVTQLKPGIYFLKVYSDEQMFALKFVKE